MKPLLRQPSATLSVGSRRARDRERHPRAPDFVVERPEGVEPVGHGLATRQARVEALALIVDGLRRHRALIPETKDREAYGTRLQCRVIWDVVLFEHHVLRHQEDGQVERESCVAGDVCDEDLATLGRQILVDERDAKFGPSVYNTCTTCITINTRITRTADRRCIRVNNRLL